MSVQIDEESTQLRGRLTSDQNATDSHVGEATCIEPNREASLYLRTHPPRTSSLVVSRHHENDQGRSKRGWWYRGYRATQTMPIFAAVPSILRYETRVLVRVDVRLCHIVARSDDSQKQDATPLQSSAMSCFFF